MVAGDPADSRSDFQRHIGVGERQNTGHSIIQVDGPSGVETRYETKTGTVAHVSLRAPYMSAGKVG